MAQATDVLRTEIAYYDTQKKLLLGHHEGQFALVSGQHLLGTFTTEEEAYKAGLAQVGNVPFLIRRIRTNEPALQAPVLFVGTVFDSVPK